MKRSHSAKESPGNFPSLVREAEIGGLAAITRHEKAVAHVLGAEGLAALIETVDTLANPAAMKAIAEARLDEDESTRSRVSGNEI